MRRSWKGGQSTRKPRREPLTQAAQDGNRCQALLGRRSQVSNRLNTPELSDSDDNSSSAEDSHSDEEIEPTDSEEEDDDIANWDPLPEDPELAVVEVRRRIAQRGGQEPLVRVTMEFADDQTQVMALERQAGVPKEWRVEEQILATDATERLRICNGSIERGGEFRCPHCNYISVVESRVHTHMSKRCKFQPVARRRDSVVGRMLERRDVAAQQQQFPPIALLDPDSNEEVTLQAKHDTV